MDKEIIMREKVRCGNMETYTGFLVSNTAAYQYTF